MTLDKNIQSQLTELYEGYLATLEEGLPYVSAAAFIFEPRNDKERFYFLLSDLARHTKNVKSHPGVSLLIPFKAPDKGFYETPRLTVQGQARLVEDEQTLKELRESYARKVPQSGSFMSLPDFRFYVLEPASFHWIGGFGKAKTYHV